MTPTNRSTALDIVLEYHRAWTSGHVDQAMTFISEDFECKAPSGPLGKQAFREYLERFVPNLTGVADVARFVEGGHVALIYYPQTTVTNTTPATEYFTVRDGRIVESLLMFDRLSYAPPNQE
ncbi:MAG: nuclear transport factor 2 family protein [Sphingosinicella sp.]|nr:nuclear transport factor 2 family protein [Sphingosinicella sp.]